MIELYSENQTDFSRHGITLHPQKCAVTWQGAGRYDLDMSMPLTESGFPAAEAALLAYGRILYASVPPHHTPDIDMGEISYWKVPDDAAEPVPLYKNLGHNERVTYTAWTPNRSYMAGQKVTDGGQNYQCTTGHGGITTPPAQNPTLWDEISNYRYVPGTVLEWLAPGAMITKTGDFNSTYMRAASTTGKRGFVQISKVVQVGDEEQYIIPGRDIAAQPFRITEIRKQSEAGIITVHATHISYLLNGMLLGDCSLTSASPQTALAFVQSAMMETWDGLIVTNLYGIPITEDYSWKMAGDVLLNPKTGIIKQLNAKVIRDGRDVFILGNDVADPVTPTYQIAYGCNLNGVDWKGNADRLVTRVYPRAKAADGTPLTLPEMYIETTRSIPWTAMELLDVDAKVGEKEVQTDGTEITLTEEDVLQRMRYAATARFTLDNCDRPEVTLDLDFTRMSDTEEYAQYRGMETVGPYDWIKVLHGPMDLSSVVQMVGFVWDAILEKYNRSSYGDIRRYTGRNVTDWDLKSGAVTARTLSEPLKKRLGV